MRSLPFVALILVCVSACGSSDKGTTSPNVTEGGDTGTGGSSSGGSSASGGSATGGGGSGGSENGGAGTGGAANGGAAAGGASPGTVPVSAVDCKYGPTASTCAGYWECDPNPNDTTPFDTCEHGPTGSNVMSWCCTKAFCSHYAGIEALCQGLYPDKQKGYLCAPNTPGTDKCVQPNPIGTPQGYCCP